MKRKKGALPIAWTAAVLLGLAAGVAVLFLTHAGQAAEGLGQLLGYAVSSVGRLGAALRFAAVLMLLGLGCYVSASAGGTALGVPGQFIAGAAAALLGAALNQWGLCLLLGAAAGCAWGMLPRLFRGHAAGAAVLLDWAAYFTADALLAGLPFQPGDKAARLAAVHPGAMPPALGGSFVNAAVPVALACAAAVWFLIRSTTLGYEIRACALNRQAAWNAGVRVNQRETLAAGLCGGLAGLAGGLFFLLDASTYALSGALPSVAFYAVPSALLGMAHPLAAVGSALVVAWLRSGQTALNKLIGQQDARLVAGAALYLGALALLAWRGMRRGK